MFASSRCSERNTSASAKIASALVVWKALTGTARPMSRTIKRILTQRRNGAKEALKFFFAALRLCVGDCMGLAQSKPFLSLQHVGSVFDIFFGIKCCGWVSHAVNPVVRTHAFDHHPINVHSINIHAMTRRLFIVAAIFHAVIARSISRRATSNARVSL